MAEQRTRPEVIDSDGHVIEPAAVWREYAEPEFRELLDHPGGGWVQWTGIQRAYPEMPPAFLDGGGGGEDDWEMNAAGERSDWDEESKYKMSRPGGHDPVARLVDMDEEGIDVAVLYPTAMLTWVEEADIFGAACRAYNNWLHDYCAVAPSRLYPVALVPLQDPEAAIVEMKRAVEHLGAKAVMIRPAAYIDGQKLNHPAYDPFWAAAAELDCPIGVHPSPHGDMPNSCQLLGLADGVTNPTEGLALRQGITNAFDLQMAVAYFTLGGICERHPSLRVAFLEGTGGWIVPMLQRFDHQFEIFGSSDQVTRPSELFARQCMVSFDPDEVALAFTAEHLGAERILWASDYPHPDAKIPGVVAELFDAVKPLPAESQRLVVGATARAFYKL
jgi:predicted TIM-barrel fold metal-dependent hydrolase